MSNFDDNIKEQIKSNIGGVVVSYGLKLNPQMKALCPFHDEKTPSFSIDTEKQTFNCFGCKAGGDALTFIAKMEKLDLSSDFHIIKKKGCEILNIDTTNPARKPKATPKPKPKKEEPWDYATVANTCHQILNNILSMTKKNPTYQTVSEILEASGFTADHIKIGKLGWDSLSKMITLPYFDGDICHRLKLINKAHPDIKVSHYPWSDMHRSDKTHVKYNELNKGFSDRNCIKPPTPPKFYNHEVLNGDCEVYLMAGEKDCLTAMINGVHNVISNYFGEGNINEGMAKQLKNKDVSIMYDVDESGREGAKDVAKALATHANSIKIIDLSSICSDGEDLTDYFIKYKKEKKDLIKLVNQTKKEANAKPTTPPKQPTTAPIDSPTDTLEAQSTGNNMDTVHALMIAYISSSSVIFDPLSLDFFIYKKTVWEVIDRAYLKSDIYLFLERNASSKMTEAKIAERIISAIECKRILPKENKMNGLVDILNVQNGMVDITGEPKLLPHDEANYSSIQLDLEFDQHATCDTFLAFLKSVFKGDQAQIDIVQEIFGYCLTSSTQAQKGFFLKGHGSDGKSTLLKILTLMVSEQNVARLSFKDLGGKFNKQDLVGKMVNISTEIDHNINCDTGDYKSLVTGDSVHAEQKLKNKKIKFTPTAKFIFAGNHLPKVTDDSHGFSRRPVILCFDNKFEGKTDDKDIFSKLAKEMTGIFMWSLDGLTRLRNEGEAWVFTYSEIANSALDEYMGEINPIRRFIEDKCVIGEGYQIETALLFAKYIGWCETNVLPKPSEVTFGKSILSEYPVKKSRIRAINGNRVPTYIGVKYVNL
jgi:putative DNA primase/helicase